MVLITKILHKHLRWS